MQGPLAVDVSPLQTAHRVRGIGRYVRGLVQQLNEQDEVPLVFIGWKGDLNFEVRTPHKLRLLMRPPMPDYRGAWLFAQAGLAAHITRGGYRCVHVTAPEALIRAKHTAILTTVYDLIPLREGVRRLSPVARVGYGRYLDSLKKAQGYFAISDQTAQDLGTFLGSSSSIVVAPPGIDIPAGASRAPSRQPYPFFLFVGGPNSNKNLDVVLAALSMARDLPETLLVAGTWLPRQSAALTLHLDRLDLDGRVRLLGHVSDQDLWQLMRDATAVIVPSTAEGFGLPVAEAMAVGAVLIHSNIPVFQATTRGNALSFSVDSAVELKAHMEKVSTNPALRLALRKRNRDQAQAMTWDDALTKTLALYKRWAATL